MQQRHALGSVRQSHDTATHTTHGAPFPAGRRPLFFCFCRRLHAPGSSSPAARHTPCCVLQMRGPHTVLCCGEAGGALPHHSSCCRGAPWHRPGCPPAHTQRPCSTTAHRRGGWYNPAGEKGTAQHHPQAGGRGLGAPGLSQPLPTFDASNGHWPLPAAATQPPHTQRGCGDTRLDHQPTHWGDRDKPLSWPASVNRGRIAWPAL
jgi:hypothetical protein